MDGGIIQFIIYAVIFFRIVMFLNKMRGGGKKNKPKSPSFFDTIQKQLKELEQSFEETPTPTGKPTKPIPIPEYVAERAPKPQPLYQPAKSSEILEAPYSNLEEGIIDSVHQSKFKHHDSSQFKHFDSSAFEHFDSSDFEHRDITQDEIGKETKKIGRNYLKGFDAKRAFVHSIIFERKHFDV